MIAKEHFEPYVHTGSSGFDETCYVCGKYGSVSFRALINSGTEESIVNMFNILGLNATAVSMRDGSPPDIKVGTCKEHLSQHMKLEDLTRKRKSVNLATIVESLK